MTVQLVPFEASHLPVVQPWFDHPEVEQRLGGRDWPARELALVSQTPGTEYRGAFVTGRFNWVAFDGEDVVGLIGGETYNRWTSYGGEGPDGSIVLDSIELPAMELAFVVDPTQWGRGYCKAMLDAVLVRPEVADVRVFGGGVEPDNVACILCLKRAGFVRLSDEQDWEGMLNFILTR